MFNERTFIRTFCIYLFILFYKRIIEILALGCVILAARHYDWDRENVFARVSVTSEESDSGNSREDLECTVSHGDLAARGKNGVTRRSCCQSLEHNTFFI